MQVVQLFIVFFFFFRNESDYISLLERFVMKDEEHKKRKPNGFRHDDESLNHFAMTSRILSGPQHYEWMRANFPGIFPSLSTLDEKINKYHGSNKTISEGEINLEPLLNYIESNKLKRIVLVAADATATAENLENQVLLLSEYLHTGRTISSQLKTAKRACEQSLQN